MTRSPRLRPNCRHPETGSTGESKGRPAARGCLGSGGQETYWLNAWLTELGEGRGDFVNSAACCDEQPQQHPSLVWVKKPTTDQASLK